MFMQKFASHFFGLVLLALPALAFSEEAITISAGYSHTCTSSDTGTSQCWGALRSRDLTVGKVSDVQAGNGFSCALLTTNDVNCWGLNDFGQLGSPTGAAPEQTVRGVTNVSRIAVGARHACALTRSGEVYCWGDGSQGQLGEAAASAQAGAMKIPGFDNVLRVAAGVSSTCVVFANGTAACVGAGSQLSGTAPQAIREVPGVTDAADIAVSDALGCLLRVNGEVACWGKNSNGQLGSVPDNSTTSTPILIKGLDGPARMVSVGGGYACALLLKGTISCWGNNSSGQLGTGWPRKEYQPVGSVVGITNALSISAGEKHTCAVLDGGYVNCWGTPDDGRLGIGLCDTNTAIYPGFAYNAPSANNAGCLAPATGAATPYAVNGLGPNKDIVLVLDWANRNLPGIFPRTANYLEIISNYYTQNYLNDRFVYVNVHGTPKLVFIGPESNFVLVDLGPLSNWVREAKK